MDESIKYSATTKGFYSSGIKYAKIPSDAVDVSNDDYIHLMVGQENGKQIVPSPDGYPVLKDVPPV